MSSSGTLSDAIAFLRNKPKADKIFRLLLNKHGAYFWWFVKEAGCSPEEVREGLKELEDADLIEQVGSADDPSDAYYTVSKLAEYVRPVYP